MVDYQPIAELVKQIPADTSAKRAEELAADRDLAGVAVSLRIILAITTPFRACALGGCLGARSRLSSNSSNIMAGRRF
jgi:hypothetical protein